MVNLDRFKVSNVLEHGLKCACFGPSSSFFGNCPLKANTLPRGQVFLSLMPRDHVILQDVLKVSSRSTKFVWRKVTRRCDMGKV